MDIPILYEDHSLLVVNKPAGLVVNDCDTQTGNITLQSWIKDRFQLLFSNDNNDFNMRSGIVHRLDKQTSGVLIVAKNIDVFNVLTRLFSERLVKKRYIAIVYGADDSFKVGDEITIDAPIARNPRDRMKFAVVETGKSAITYINVVKTFEYIEEKFSVVECYPKTGRTHQIRVHLTALGHPVVGDELYAGRKRYKKHKDIFKRQYLHAQNIQFTHPVSGTEISIEAPIPNDMETMLNLS